jgi:hypothetical protein
VKLFGDLSGKNRGGGATTIGRTMGLTVAALVAASALALPGPARADGQYPTSGACAATPAAITPGATVTFSCADGTFSPFQSVLVIVEGATDAGIGSLSFEAPSTGTTISTASGAISVPITFPSGAAGSYDIAAASATSAGGSTVSVSGTTDAANSTPPSRGSGWLLGAWLGGGLLVLTGGAIAVGTSVRRNRRAHERLTP